ncbi:unnamed protein product [Lactuca virosa]|uniref:GH18 domain-containing protein n=1 Tax=Lactuca virosa TaxID=75947 RepID=A0AAU9NBM1_9ASTR|nr:unnamed protein product [Lactuca virosa]
MWNLQSGFFLFKTAAENIIKTQKKTPSLASKQNLQGIPICQKALLICSLIKTGFSELFILLFTLQAHLAMASRQPIAPKSYLFSEYIGAEDNNVKFSDVPINPNVEFHYILAFAIDYTNSSSPSPTNGEFKIFWDTHNLSPSQVSSIKISSVDSWVSNAVSSLTKIIQEYNLDGIDIDYEHFVSDQVTFVECIGKLITTLKNNGVITFASIAPFDDDDEVKRNYMALWTSYAHVIDYVNFQFYAYDKGTTVSQFMRYFQTQRDNYGGGNILASITTEGSGGLSPKNGFFTACKRLKSQGKLGGIFVWSADNSKALGFKYEKQSQAILATSHKNFSV